MSEIIRTISIVILLILGLFCVQTGFFLISGHKLKNNSRKSLVLLEFITGLLLIFDALAYIYRGNTNHIGYTMVRVSNFMVFTLNYFMTFFFCFYSAEFIKSDSLDFNILRSPKKAAKNGVPVHLFIVFYICILGIALTIISQFTNLFYYFDEGNFYHRNSLYPLSIILGLSPGLIAFEMLLQNKKLLPNNVFISLLIYPLFLVTGIILTLFSYGISWIDIGYGLGALHLFYSSIKLMELEFYSDKKEGLRLNPTYKTSTFIPEIKKRIVKSHIWQVIAAVSGGLILVLTIVSITGISIPERKLVINKPFLQNDNSKSVYVTFNRDTEKVWNDNDDYTRMGAQYNGVQLLNSFLSPSILILNLGSYIFLITNCSLLL